MVRTDKVLTESLLNLIGAQYFPHADTRGLPLIKPSLVLGLCH